MAYGMKIGISNLKTALNEIIPNPSVGGTYHRLTHRVNRILDSAPALSSMAITVSSDKSCIAHRQHLGAYNSHQTLKHLRRASEWSAASRIFAARWQFSRAIEGKAGHGNHIHASENLILSRIDHDARPVVHQEIEAWPLAENKNRVMRLRRYFSFFAS